MASYAPELKGRTSKLSIFTLCYRRLNPGPGHQVMYPVIYLFILKSLRQELRKLQSFPGWPVYELVTLLPPPPGVCDDRYVPPCPTSLAFLFARYLSQMKTQRLLLLILSQLLSSVFFLLYVLLQDVYLNVTFSPGLSFNASSAGRLLSTQSKCPLSITFSLLWVSFSLYLSISEIILSLSTVFF